MRYPAANARSRAGTKAESAFQTGAIGSRFGTTAAAASACGVGGEHRRRFRVAVSGFEEEGIPSGGEVRRVPALRSRVFGNGEAVHDPRARASLLQMAQVWFRLADRMPADAKDESHQVEG